MGGSGRGGGYIFYTPPHTHTPPTFTQSDGWSEADMENDGGHEVATEGEGGDHTVCRAADLEQTTDERATKTPSMYIGAYHVYH